MGKKKFSDLTATTALGLNDLFASSQVDTQAQTGYTSKKINAGNVAKSIVNDFEYPTDLPAFTNKTITGALNEIHNGTYLYKENETPYAIRQTPITANRCLEKLIGVSCAFNQLVNVISSSYTLASVSFSGADDTITLTVSNSNAPKVASFSVIQNHVYYYSGACKLGSGNGTQAFFGFFSSAFSSLQVVRAYSTDYVSGSGFYKPTNSNDRFGLRMDNNAELNSTGIFNKIQLIDLTAMFGSEVADYLYNLENS